MAGWAERTGLRQHLIASRLDALGWDVDRALTEPPRDMNAVKFRGETKGAREWAQIVGINQKTIEERLRRGWSPERALTEQPSAALAGRPQCSTRNKEPSA